MEYSPSEKLEAQDKANERRAGMEEAKFYTIFLQELLVKVLERIPKNSIKLELGEMAANMKVGDMLVTPRDNENTTEKIRDVMRNIVEATMQHAQSTVPSFKLPTTFSVDVDELAQMKFIDFVNYLHDTELTLIRNEYSSKTK